MRRGLWVFVLMSLLLAVPTFAQDAESNTVFVRVAHLASDAPAVDIYIDGEIAIENVAFTEVTDFVDLVAGSYFLSVTETGASADEALLSTVYTMVGGDWLTIAAIGTVAEDDLALEFLVDDYTATVDDAVVSVIHAVPDVDPVIVVPDNTDALPELAYIGEDGDFLTQTLTSGDYAFDIQNADGESLLTVDSTTLEAGSAYLIAVVGTADAPQVIVAVSNIAEVAGLTGDADNVSTLLVRIGHFSVSAPIVDVYLDGELLRENVDFGNVSEYFPAPAGTFTVALTTADGSLEDALYTGEITLEADSITLIAAVGFVENESLEVVTATENNIAPEGGRTRIAFFQAVPSISLFDLLANNSTLIQGVAYPEAFTGAGDGYVSVDLGAGEYELVVQGAGQTITVGNILTGSNRVYLVVVSGTEQSPLYFLVSGDFPTQVE
ncbi:MAG: DUF4397 domain-containing protein [Chloroflexota bacterium]